MKQFINLSMLMFLFFASGGNETSGEFFDFLHPPVGLNGKTVLLQNELINGKDPLMRELIHHELKNALFVLRNYIRLTLVQILASQYGVSRELIIDEKPLFFALGHLEHYQRNPVVSRRWSEEIESYVNLFKKTISFIQAIDQSRESDEDDFSNILKILDENLPFLIQAKKWVKERDYEDGSLGKLSQVIDQSLEKQIQLVHKAIVWSGRSMDYVNVHQWVQDIATTLSNEPWVRGILFHFEISDEIQGLPSIFTYKEILDHGIQELVKNAAKYSKTDRIDVFISLDSEGEIITVVKDYGKGLSHERLDPNSDNYLFTPGLTEAENRRMGTGWGLFSLERAIESVGGKISVESQVGKGTSFRFTLPANAPITVIQKPRLERPLFIEFAGLQGSGRRVTARQVAGELGLRYINGGFLMRILVYYLLEESKKIQLDLGNQDQVTDFVRSLLESGDLDYSTEPVRVQGIETTQPDEEGLALRDRIKQVIDHNDENTKWLHTIAKYQGVQDQIREFLTRQLVSDYESRQYNGILLKTTEPYRNLGFAQEAEVTQMSFLFLADAKTRAARVRRPAPQIEEWDVYTGRNDLVKKYPEQKGRVQHIITEGKKVKQITQEVLQNLICT